MPEQLAANAGLKQALKTEAARGLPIYAECGGLMYLAREIRDLEGRVHPMAGSCPFSVRMLPRLKALGYREVTLAAASLLGPGGTHGPGARIPLLGNRRRAPGCPASTASPPAGAARP